MQDTKSLKRINDEFQIQHVGSSLLNELAKGLYIPETVLREYMQNAIDAHRLWEVETGYKPVNPIQVEFRKNGISILDYGVGMDEVEVRNVKAVAVSPKQKFETDVGLTGHKGVGIWAGLSFFETLTLRTSKQGSDKGYQLRVQFDKILQSIDYKTDIGTALNPNYEIYQYPEELDSHYSDVTLENPTQSPEWFLDRMKIEDALRRICPCRINPNFVFQEEVSEWYKHNGFEMFDITLDGSPIHRDYPSAVEGFTQEIFTVNDNPVANVWYAVSKKSMLKPNPGQLRGFRIFQNGFVIGGTNPYSSRNLPGFEELSIGQYPHWYVGEIHVISPELRPNLPRNDFEESEDKRKFVQKIRRWYNQLAVQCMVLGQKRKRLKAYTAYKQEVDGLLSGLAPLTLTPSDRDALVEIRNDLIEDDKIADQDKRGKSPKSAAPIDGRRDLEVKRLRRDLQSEIDKLLASSPEPDSGLNTHGIAQESKDDSPHEIDKEDLEESVALPASASEPSLITEPLWADYEEVEEVDDGSGYVLVDVVLSLLEEILREEIPDLPEQQVIIVNKLQNRINPVVPNA